MTDLKSSGTPIHKLHSLVILDGCDGSIDILGYNIAAIKKTNSHVLALSRITSHHLTGWFKASLSYLVNRHPLVICLTTKTIKAHNF